MSQVPNEHAPLIERVRSLISDFERAGRGERREVSFLRSCEEMISKRGGVTANMSRWLDHILQKGGPKEPSEAAREEIERLESYLPDAGVHAEIIQNACDILRDGREISERFRETLSDTLLVIERSRREGPLRVNEARALGFARTVLDGYSVGYRSERPRSFSVGYEVCNKFEAGQEVSRTDWNALTSAAPRLREIANPRFEVGELLYHKPLGKIVVVTSLPEPDARGDVCYNVLVDGEVKLTPLVSLRVRIPRDV